MTLQGESKLFRHGKADTMYVTIPAAIVKDSAFTFKEGQRVKVRFDPKTRTVVIKAHKDGSKNVIPV